MFVRRCVFNRRRDEKGRSAEAVVTDSQWRTQKIFMGGFHSVAYGGHLYLVCAVCDVTI